MLLVGLRSSKQKGKKRPVKGGGGQAVTSQTKGEGPDAPPEKVNLFSGKKEVMKNKGRKELVRLARRKQKKKKKTVRRKGKRKRRGALISQTYFEEKKRSSGRVGGGEGKV